MKPSGIIYTSRISHILLESLPRLPMWYQITRRNQKGTYYNLLVLEGEMSWLIFFPWTKYLKVWTLGDIQQITENNSVCPQSVKITETEIWFVLFPFFHLLMHSLMGVPMTLLFGLQSAYLAELQERWNAACSFPVLCSKQRLSASRGPMWALSGSKKFSYILLVKTCNKTD